MATGEKGIFWPSKRVTSLIVQCTCYISFLCNLVYVSLRFFAFDTETNIGFYTPVYVVSPNLSLCFDLSTIVSDNHKLILDEHYPRYLGLLDQQILQLVPRTNDVLKDCAFRDFETEEIENAVNASECSSIFTIQRYRMQGYMCYLFQLNKHNTFSFHSLAFALHEQRLLYKLAIDYPLNKGHVVAPILHLDELADVDRIFMKELFPSNTTNELFYLDYDLYEIYRLPHPYTTKCGPDPRLRCIYNCINQIFAMKGFSPSTGLSRETTGKSDLLLRVADYSDAKKAVEMLKMWNETRPICSKLCKSEACKQQLVITYASAPFENKVHKLSFHVTTFKNPIYKVVYSVKLSFIEYITQCFSLSGIWLGFSVISVLCRSQNFQIGRVCVTLNSLRSKVEQMKRFYPIESTDGHFFSQVGRTSGTSKTKKYIRWVKMFLWVSFKVVAIIAFAVQAIELCVSYMKYQTVFKHNHLMDPKYSNKLPSTAICITVKDLYNASNLNEITEYNYKGMMGMRNKWFNSSMASILDGTIGDEVLYRCKTRVLDRFKFADLFKLKSRAKCLTEFNYHKYYSRGRICHLFTPKVTNLNMEQSFVAFREINPSKFYSLILSPRLKNKTLDLIVYFDSENASYISNDYAAQSTKIAEKRVVVLTFQTIVFEFLPLPYDTKCNPTKSFSKCKNICLQKGLAKYQRLPYGNTIVDHSELRLLSFEDLNNSTLNRFWRRLENYCTKNCNSFICSGDYTLTYSNHVLGRTVYDVEIVVNVESKPRTYSKSMPLFPFYEFYYLLFCLCTFWLNLSFIGLDVIKKKQQRQVDHFVRLLYAKSLSLLRSVNSMRRNLRSKKNNSKRNSLTKSYCHLICISGMCLHLVCPFLQYFQYPTILLTKALVEDPSAYKFILCSEVQALFEEGLIFSDESDKYKDILDKQINDILTEGRKLNNFIASCGYWGLSRDRNEPNSMQRATDRVFFESTNASICAQNLQSRIFMRQGHICFQFKLLRKLIWTQTQMLNTFNHMKTILSVSINSSIISQRFTVIAHMDTGYDPHHSSIWTPIVHKKSCDCRYVVSYNKYSFLLLPYPYSTQGFIPGQITHCFVHCVNQVFNKYNLTRTYLGDKRTDYKLITCSLRKNSMMNIMTHNVENECAKRCSRIIDYFDGKTDLMLSTVSLISEPQPYSGPRKGTTRFDLRRSDNPSVSMTFLVELSIYDLIINIGSIISIWYGISVINIPDTLSRNHSSNIRSEILNNVNQVKCLVKQMLIQRHSNDLRTSTLS